MATKANDNLRIWSALERTDPDFAKDFAGKGGFRGTAIDSTYNIKRVTELLGPVGVGWGWKILSERLDRVPVEGESDRIWHVVHVRFWQRAADGSIGEWDEFGQTPVAYTSQAKERGGKPRYVTDDDYAKKSITDAISKGMLRLGASADVWMKTFDGNRYVHPAGKDVEEPQKVASDIAASVVQWGRACLDALNTNPTKATIAKVNGESELLDFDEKLTRYELLEQIDADLVGQIVAAIKAAKARVAKAA